MDEARTEQEETAKKPKVTPAQVIAEIKRYEKEYDSWTKRAKAIVKRYRDDDRSVIDDEVGKLWGDMRFNVLWSNVETLKPTLYARTPKPESERRFKDADPDGRVAATISERIGQCLVSGDDNDDSFDVVMTQCRDDYLLPGRGQAWVRYDTASALLIGEDGKPILDEDGSTLPDPDAAQVAVDYVPWSDFGHNVARFWKEVYMVWRKLTLTKEEIAEKLGKGAAEAANYDQKHEGEETKDLPGRAAIYEVWHKPSRKVYWVDLRNADKFISDKDDFLQLRNFFPCPRPLYATTTTDSLKPIPDYQQYQALAEELDLLTNRKQALIQAAQVKGARDANHPELDALINGTSETGLVPVSNWNQFMGDGGLENLIVWLPLEAILQGIQFLSQEIDRVKALLYEVTGIADIIRGNTSPSETATAQQLKGQFASLRIEERQRAIQRFGRDLINIMIEVAVEHFSPEKLAEIAGVAQMPQDEQQRFMNALQILKDDKQRKYRISIETDSTINIDENTEKEKRNEFLQAVGSLIQNTVAMIQQVPELAPALVQTLLFGVRGYRAGRELESAYEQSFAALQQRLQQPQEPQPDPAQQEMQAKMEMEQQKMQMEMQKQQASMQLEIQKLQQQIQIEQAKLEAEREKFMQELALRREELEAELALKAHAQGSKDVEAVNQVGM